MRFERFTDRARRLIVLAQDVAERNGDEYIGCEHLLLAMATEGESLAGKSLAAVGVTAERAQMWMKAPAGPPTSLHRQLPFTEAAKKVLELSLRESLAVEAGYIGTEHILAGWIRWAFGTARKSAQS